MGLEVRNGPGVKVIAILYPLGATAELFLWTQRWASTLKLWEEPQLVWTLSPGPDQQNRTMDRSNDWPYMDEGGWTLGLPNPAATLPRSGGPTTWILSGSCQPGAATSQGLQLPEFGEWSWWGLLKPPSPAGKPGRAPGTSCLNGVALLFPSLLFFWNETALKKKRKLIFSLGPHDGVCQLLPPKRPLLLSCSNQQVGGGQTGLGSSASTP